MKGIELLPLATELERFEMGELEPTAGTLFYLGGPAKGAKVQCYLSASAIEVIALKPKKVTKANAEGFAIGSYVLKVAWHGPIAQVQSFTA